MQSDRATETVFLGLGGNIGDVTGAFARAVGKIDEHPLCKVLQSSSLWRSKPWGKTDQPDFLNMILRIETRLTARDLLDFCLALETEAGRLRTEVWGPRPLDIDIIAFGSLECSGKDITLPHPRAHERLFVLAPLAEIAPGLQLHGKAVDGRLNELLKNAALGDCVVDRAETEVFLAAIRGG